MTPVSGDVAFMTSRSMSQFPEKRVAPNNKNLEEEEAEELVRVSLHRKQPSLGQYQTTCISKHYALNNQILAAFESHYRQQLHKVAFYLGLKFVETALLEIPKHGYFYSEKFAPQRIQSFLDALRVTHVLKEIIDNHASLAKETAKVERLGYLATELYERLDTYEEKRLVVEADLDRLYRNTVHAPGQHRGAVGQLKVETRDTGSRGMFRSKGSSAVSSFSDCDVGSTLLACGESISSVFCPSASLSTSTPSNSRAKIADRQFPPLPSSPRKLDDGSSERFPSYTRASPLFPPTNSSKPEVSSVKDLYPPQTVYQLNQTSLMDEDDDNDDTDNLVLIDDSAYTYGKRTRVNHDTVYLEEENKLPPSYNDIFNLYGSNNKPKETSKPEQQTNGQLVAATAIPLGKVNSGAGNSMLSQDPPGHIRTQSDYDLQRALYLSGLQVLTDDAMRRERSQESVGVFVSSDDEGDEDVETKDMTQEERRDDPPSIYFHSSGNNVDETEDAAGGVPAPPGAKRRHPASGVSVDILRSCYREDFDALRDNGRVIISQIPTYQGRVLDSTNGCTVIAPLLCIHHFHNDEKEEEMVVNTSGFTPDPGLPDRVIVEVIDKETPNILPAVRRNLGLVPNAFLIPADAHESLMEQQYMCPEQFLTVCGGNILDEKHLEPLLEQLSVVGPKKLAATFFFHEHVITILQLRRSPNAVWFDIIDSLPTRTTLRQKNEDFPPGSISSGSVLGSERDQVLSSSGMSGNSNIAASSERYPVEGSFLERSSSGGVSEDDWADCESTELQRQQMLVDNIPAPPNAARIRCLDTEALKATLRWYACSVFTTENISYIDTYLWDENLTDFDPRVFQAFVWTEV